jgi:aerobic-type carbon monoxide dehydrogenase small subunit (CoxS/CutS family)
MSGREIVLRVNGSEYEVRAGTRTSLATVLREELGLTGTKIMCNEGECGACTVIIDGATALSCMTLAVDCAGRDILTIEGLAATNGGELHPLQTTFVEKSGMQCGVCTGGMILTAKVLLDENPDPTEAEVRQALSGNLCRCGNYPRITECVLDAAEIMRAQREHEIRLVEPEPEMQRAGDRE